MEVDSDDGENHKDDERVKVESEENESRKVESEESESGKEEHPDESELRTTPKIEEVQAEESTMPTQDGASENTNEDEGANQPTMQPKPTVQREGVFELKERMDRSFRKKTEAREGKDGSRHRRHSLKPWCLGAANVMWDEVANEGATRRVSLPDMNNATAYGENSKQQSDIKSWQLEAQRSQQPNDLGVLPVGSHHSSQRGSSEVGRQSATERSPDLQSEAPSRRRNSAATFHCDVDGATADGAVKRTSIAFSVDASDAENALKTYLLSMGTSERVANKMASKFIDQHAVEDVEPPNGDKNPDVDVAADEQSNAYPASTGPMQDVSMHEPPSEQRDLPMPAQEPPMQGPIPQQPWNGPTNPMGQQQQQQQLPVDYTGGYDLEQPPMNGQFDGQQVPLGGYDHTFNGPGMDVENGLYPQNTFSPGMPVRDGIAFSDEGSKSPSRSKVPLATHPLKTCLIGTLLLTTLVVSVVAIIISLGAQNRTALAPMTGAPTQGPTMAPTFIRESVLDRAATLTARSILETPGSPQQRAVGWLSSIDRWSWQSALTNTAFAQRYAMVVLSYAAGVEEALLAGNSTTAQQLSDTREGSTNWLNPGMHECDWSDNIRCTTIDGERMVERIDFANRGLEGTLPAEIGLFSRAEFIRFSENKLTGQIPDNLSGLSVLSVLDVRGNLLGGPIPDTVRLMPGLTYLDLSSNTLTGSIPESLYELSGLRMLDVGSNRLTGALSPRFSNMRSLAFLSIKSNMFTRTLPALNTSTIPPPLEFMYVNDNLFTGTIPDWVGSMVTRQEINLSRNFFNGTFPALPVQLIADLLTVAPDELQLRRLDLSHNDISGTISPLMQYLPKLEYIDLTNNAMTGRLSLGLLDGETGGQFALRAEVFASLKEFHAANNRFTGTFPSFMPHSLQVLDVRGNQLQDNVSPNCTAPALQTLLVDDNPLFSGPIKDTLRCSPSLERLSMKGCNLSGSIPAGIGNYTTLKELSVANNALTGPIPAEIGGLSALEILDLSTNSITGSIPPELADLSSLQTLLLAQNLLTGPIPNTLNRLWDLKRFTVNGNVGLSGAAPCIILKEIDTADVGCAVECFCCTNRTATCPP